MAKTQSQKIDALITLIKRLDLPQTEQTDLINQLKRDGMSDLMRAKLLKLFEDQAARLTQDLELIHTEQVSNDQKIEHAEHETAQYVTSEYTKWKSENQPTIDQLNRIKIDAEKRLVAKGISREDLDVEEITKLLKP